MTAQTDTPSADYVEIELVDMLYQHSWPMSLAVGLTASLFTAYMFAGQVPLAWCVIWFAAINAIIAARIGLILRFRYRPPPRAHYPRWGTYYLCTVWLNGMAWGLPAFVLSGDNLTLTFFYATVMSGFVAGAIPGLTYNLNAFYGFALFSGTPLIVQLFQFEDAFFHIIGVLAVMFLAINIASVRISNRRVREQIHLQFANRQLVERLTAEKDRAERAVAVKSQFLAAASHDLRQPLHALGLFVDALDARTERPAVGRLVESIKQSTASLSELLDALLDISRLDAGALEPERSPVQLQGLLTRLAAEFRADASAKGLSLRVVPCRAWVLSDPTMLTRILQNVLGNAIRYTEAGKVLIGCRRRGADICIEVHDSGIGMSRVQLEHVFEEFYQAGNPQRDRRLGLGLGLAIVRRLSDILGHTVALTSRSGRGTIFRLRVPRAPAGSPIEQPQVPAADLSGVRVLVIDNEEPVREAMHAMMSVWSCEVLSADSCHAALELLRQTVDPPDLIVADYRLGDGVDGLAAIDAVHALYQRDIPAIVITGDTDPQRVREAADSGHQLLHKPVSAARLRSLVSYLLRRPADDPQRISAGPTRD